MKSVLFQILLLTVVSHVNCTEKKDSSEFQQFIGKTYSKITQLNTSFELGSFISFGTNGEYGLINCGSKAWVDKEGRALKTLILFTKEAGKSANSSIEKVLDAVFVNMSDFKPGSTVALDECTLSNSSESEENVVTVSVYLLDENNKPVQPQKAWIADTKSEKLIPIAPEKLLCVPTENEGDGEGEE
jgi:hypothetical protein